MAAIVLIPELACRIVPARDSARQALLLLPQYNPQCKQDQEELQNIDTSPESETQPPRAKAAARIEEQLRTNPDHTAGLEARLNSEPARTTRVAAAVSPSPSANAGVVRKALLALFGFVGLGLVAAIVARKLRPHVHFASDVERLLGQGLTAQLPDFAEVSGEVAEEYLLRLALSVESASRGGKLRSFVFTGTGPGVGVTRIVERVKEILAALGKEAVLVDAAPLTVSPETESLARRADCTILVMESAKTTRAQLRAAARSLRRLNPAAVGFVLNRVRLKNADESFRQSLGEVERHLRMQRRNVERTVAQSPGVVPEAAHASPVQEIAVPAEPAAAADVIAIPGALPTRQAAPEPAATQWPAPDRAVVAPPSSLQPPPDVAENREAQTSRQPARIVPPSPREPVAPAAPRAIAAVPLRFDGSASQPEPRPSRPAMQSRPKMQSRTEMPSRAEMLSRPTTPFRPRIEEPMPQPESHAPPPALQPHEDTPEWLMETPPWWMTKSQNYSDPAAEQPRAPRVEAWYAAPTHGGRESAAEEARKEVDHPDEMPAGLSALRGIHFSMGVREFGPRKDAVRDACGNDSSRGVLADAARFDPGQTKAPEILTPQPEHQPVEVKMKEIAAPTAASRGVVAEPGVLSPPAEETNKIEESQRNRAGHDTSGGGDIQILPSKPGQYKR